MIAHIAALTIVRQLVERAVGRGRARKSEVERAERFSDGGDVFSHKFNHVVVGSLALNHSPLSINIHS